MALRTHTLVHLINQQAAKSAPAIVLTQVALLAQALSGAPRTAVCCVPLRISADTHFGVNLLTGHSPSEIGALMQPLLPAEVPGKYREQVRRCVSTLASCLNDAQLPLTLLRLYTVLASREQALALSHRTPRGLAQTELQDLCRAHPSEDAWAKHTLHLGTRLQEVAEQSAVRSTWFNEDAALCLDEGLTHARLILEVPAVGPLLSVVLESLRMRMGRTAHHQEELARPVAVLALDSSSSTFDVLYPLLNEATASNVCLVHVGATPLDANQEFRTGAHVHVRELPQGLPPFATPGAVCVKVGADCSFVAP